MAMAEISMASADSTHSLAARWRDFSGWWMSELRRLVPPRWLGWAHRDVNPKVWIARHQDHVICTLASGPDPVEGRFPLRGFGSAALDAWLARNGLSRMQVKVGHVIERACFFVRDISVPKAALAALPRILDQEIQRRTPFRLAEIWHAAIPASGCSNDIVAFGHWIIRRDRAAASLAELGLGMTDVDVLCARDANGEVMPVIAFGATGDTDPPWARRAIRQLAVAALGVVAVGVGAFAWCQEGVATRLEDSLIEAREAADASQDGANQAGRLFALKANTGVLDIWDELSRILPEHTFLTETRIADGKVTVSGFSADAARLVRIIDQSPQFTGATLAAAITPDAVEHRDRFSISFRVRGVRPSAPGRSPAS